MKNFSLRFKPLNIKLNTLPRLRTSLALALLCVLPFVSLGQAADEVATAGASARQGKIAEYAGLVMADARYADVLKSLQARLAPADSLQITGYSILNISGSIFVSFEVLKKTGFGPGVKKVIGEIVGEIVLAPGPGAVVNAVYFKPAVQIPGGISVGSQ